MKREITKKKNIQKGFYIFHVSEYKELDHFSPIVFTFLKKGLDVQLLVLSNFNYKENIAYIHTDQRAMPKNKIAWSSWNSSIDNQNL